MTYRVFIDPVAQNEIDGFGDYATAYSEKFARERFAHLNHVLTVVLAESPNTWKPFYITGAPYHAYLFRVGRRWAYWIVYTIDEATRRIDVLRFWNASGDTNEFSL